MADGGGLFDDREYAVAVPRKRRPTRRQRRETARAESLGCSLMATMDARTGRWYHPDGTPMTDGEQDYFVGMLGPDSPWTKRAKAAALAHAEPSVRWQPMRNAYGLRRFVESVAQTAGCGAVEALEWWVGVNGVDGAAEVASATAVSLGLARPGDGGLVVG